MNLNDREQTFMRGWEAGHQAALDYLQNNWPDLVADFDEPGDGVLAQTRDAGEAMADSLRRLLATPAPRRGVA